MNDEIKEILQCMKRISSYYYTSDYLELNCKDVKLLYDYITNLQQELEKTRLENKLLKEQMVAMVQPTYTYGISGGSSE